jgi:hypothetical protein
MAKKPKQGKMVGKFCERTMAPKSDFDKQSFRWKKSGKAWVLVGCPKGKWAPKKAWTHCRTVKGRRRCSHEVGKCKTGTRSHKLLTPLGKRSRCPKGSRRVTKGS